jgi:hypothetical protein
VKRVLQPFVSELTALGKKNFTLPAIVQSTGIGGSHEID